METMRVLRTNKINSIIDFAVESTPPLTKTESLLNTFELFKSLIKSVDIAMSQPYSFIAIKLSSMFNQPVLQQLSCHKDLSQEDQHHYCLILYLLNSLCDKARRSGVRVFVDAEDSVVQPAINQIYINLAKTFNKGAVVVYNTYQMYLKNSLSMLTESYRLSTVHGYQVGYKLVRGAYMVSERAHAVHTRTPYPIYDTIEETHKSYDNGIKFLLSRNLPVCIATHNKNSIELAADLISYKRKKPYNVCFAQLYGMHDEYSAHLASNGLSVYKYLPYGPVEKTIPYLLRRVQENHMNKHLLEDRARILHELKRVL
jgi:proline dehydrogenase